MKALPGLLGEKCGEFFIEEGVRLTPACQKPGSPRAAALRKSSSLVAPPPQHSLILAGLRQAIGRYAL